MSRLQVPYTSVLKFDTEPMPAWGISKDNHNIVFRCKCGALFSLSKWTIDNQGCVFPSVDHTHADCSFHEHIKLDEWLVDHA